LHDDLQFAGGELSNHVCGAPNLAGQFSGCDRYSAFEQHDYRQSIVSEHLLVTTARVSDQLCADIALAVMSGAIAKRSHSIKMPGGDWFDLKRSPF
jgi:hypothetical protein